ncbi:MAP kinase-interacting serine/threonine-protein kinase 1-like [Aplysia californica]|uniref:MAP kinase-interacting serine/threonine-protein kinase 1-like n=1 Tax=Aplysia californica TaxID=6500 RepID=A0ABM0JHF9_APLCA|nr:MAP kinase-interacting serine/threonine-protein kinase 1-like [Aplysia californica]
MIVLYTTKTSTVNNTGGDCVRTETFPTNSSKQKRRQRKRHTNRLCFSDLLEPTGEKLGSGSVGGVSTFRNKETGREYAVKVIRKCRGEGLYRVKSEIEICQRYQNCESILNFLDFYTSGDTYFFVFDKISGGDLGYVYESTPYLSLSESQASRVTGAVARALRTLHSDGVAHRDIKPENILCHFPGEITPVVLCDFGLASDLPVLPLPLPIDSAPVAGDLPVLPLPLPIDPAPVAGDLPVLPLPLPIDPAPVAGDLPVRPLPLPINHLPLPVNHLPLPVDYAPSGVDYAPLPLAGKEDIKCQKPPSQKQKL